MTEQQLQQEAEIKLMTPSSLQKDNAVEGLGVFFTGKQSFGRTEKTVTLKVHHLTVNEER